MEKEDDGTERSPPRVSWQNAAAQRRAGQVARAEWHPGPGAAQEEITSPPRPGSSGGRQTRAEKAAPAPPKGSLAPSPAQRRAHRHAQVSVLANPSRAGARRPVPWRHPPYRSCPPGTV